MRLPSVCGPEGITYLVTWLVAGHSLAIAESVRLAPAWDAAVWDVHG